MGKKTFLSERLKLFRVLILDRLSTWGTLDNPLFPDFLPSHDGSMEDPWENLSNQRRDNDPYPEVPYTGVTRYYDFEVARGVLSPDGYGRFWRLCSH